MGLLELFIVSSVPVIKVLLTTTLGSVLALDRVNILGDDARKHLNKIVFYVCTPALVASNLAKALKHESVAMMWFMALNILITFIVGSALGFIILYVTRPPRHLRGLILGCCAAGNMGNMFFIIITAVCKEKGGPFGVPADCHTYGMAYASLSMAIGAMYLWSYVCNLVRMSIKNPKEIPIKGSSESITGISVAESTRNCQVPLLQPKEHEVQIDDHLGKQECTQPETSEVVFNIICDCWFCSRTSPCYAEINDCEGAPFHVIQDTALLIGDGSIPSITLVMGGNLLKGIAIVKGAIHFSLIPKDPLYQIVLLLQYAVPPAMNIATITQLFGAGQNECSVILLWTYILASVALTFWSTFFMWLVSGHLNSRLFTIA